MRKHLKLLLLVATVLVMFAMTMIVGSAETDFEFPESVDGEFGVASEEELDAALSDASWGGCDRINLTGDITITKPIDLANIAASGTFVLNGNGFTINYDADETTGEDGAVFIFGDVNVAIVDVKVTMEQNITTFATTGTGTATLYDVIAEGGYYSIYFDSAATVIVDGAKTAIGKGNANQTVYHTAKAVNAHLMVQGGKLDSTDDSGNMFAGDSALFRFTMTGGTIKSLGDVLCSNGGMIINITGNSTIEAGSGKAAINPKGDNTVINIGVEDTEKKGLNDGIKITGGGETILLRGNSSTLTVYGGTIISTADRAIFGSGMDSTGIAITIYGGTVKGHNYGVVNKGANSTLTIYDGHFEVTDTGNADASLTLVGGATTTIHNGNFYGHVHAQGGLFNIKGGYFTNRKSNLSGKDFFGIRINNDPNTVVIDGGTFEYTIGSTRTSDAASLMYISSATANVTINKGTFIKHGPEGDVIQRRNGVLTINGGTFTVAKDADGNVGGNTIYSMGGGSNHKTTINGGKFYNYGSGSVVCAAHSNGSTSNKVKLEINGGEYYTLGGEGGCAVVAYEGCTEFTINGGTYSYIELDRFKGEDFDPKLNNYDEEAIKQLQKAANSQGYDKCKGLIYIKTSATATIKNAFMMNGGAYAAIELCKNNTVNIKDCTIYGYRVLRTETAGATVNMIDCTGYNNPGHPNSVLFHLDKAIKLNIVGGSYTVAESGVTNPLLNSTAGSTVNIYGATFTHMGSGNYGILKAGHASDVITVYPAGTYTVADVEYKDLPASTFNKENGAYAFHVAIAGGTITVGEGTVLNLSKGATAINVVTDGVFSITKAQVNILEGGKLPVDAAMWADSTFVVNGWGDDIVLPAGSYEIASPEAAISLASKYISINGTYIKAGEGGNVTANISGMIPMVLNEGVTLTYTAGTYDAFVTLVKVNGGKLIVNKDASFTTESATIFKLQSGEMVLNGGDFDATGYSGEEQAMILVSGGKLTVEGGTYDLNGGCFVFCNATAEIRVNNATVTKGNTARNYFYGGLFRFGGTDNFSTLTIMDGTYTSTGMVRIYATSSSVTEDGKGVVANIYGGTYIANGNAATHTDNRYLFQIARAGRHVINMLDSDIVVRADDYTYAFNANTSSLSGPTFNIHGGTYSGGLVWVRMGNVNGNYPSTLSIKNATYTSGTVNDQNAVFALEDPSGIVTLENVTVDGTAAKYALFRPKNGVTLTVKGGTYKAAAMFYAAATGTFKFESGLFVITDAPSGKTDTCIFDNAETVIGDDVVILTDIDCTLIGEQKINKGFGQIYYAEELLNVWVKNAASSETIAPSLENGVGIYTGDETAENAGIRFTTTLSQAVIDEINKLEKAGSTVIYGTVIAPADYVVKAGAFTMDALDKLGLEIPYVNVVADESMRYDGNGDVCAFGAAIVSLNRNDRAYAGVSYICIDGEYYYGEYNSALNARSAEYLATEILAAETAGTLGDFVITDGIRKLLNSYAGTAVTE